MPLGFVTHRPQRAGLQLVPQVSQAVNSVRENEIPKLRKRPGHLGVYGISLG